MMLPAAIPAPKLLRMRAFARNMRIMGVIYLLMSVGLWFFPSTWVWTFNLGPRFLKMGEVLADPNNKIYMIFGGSYFVVLFALCFLSSESPYTRGYSLSHLLGKTVGLIGSGYLYLNDQSVFAYGMICGVEILFALTLVWNLFKIGFAPRISDPTLGDGPEFEKKTYELGRGPEISLSESTEQKSLPPGDAL